MEIHLRYFFDCEFIEDGSTIDLISIGVVAEDGREFYAESQDADLFKASPWVKDNVLPHLWSRQKDKSNGNKWTRDGGQGGFLSRADIRRGLEQFCSVDGKPEFWGYYSAYDHVALCQLFGTMMDLPNGWPYYTKDLRQFLDSFGLQDVKQPDSDIHNALEDARWIAATWKRWRLDGIQKPE